MSTGTRCNHAYTRFFWSIVEELNISVNLEWVRGYATDYFNRAVDKLANWARIYAEPKCINRNLLFKSADIFFIMHRNSLVPNLRKIIHEFYHNLFLDKLSQRNNISTKDIIVSPQNYSNFSFKN